MVSIMWMTSVILPCYNGHRWLSGAIESVLAQTYDNFELVIIDDGSTDNTEEIIAPYLRDGRVRYLHQRNSGFSSAVNRGIKESRGCLIGFIGQDDLWIPNKLELQMKYFSEHNNVSLVCSKYYSIDPKERIIRVVKAKVPNFSSKQEVIQFLFLDNFVGFETVLAKKECFDEVGLFDERMTGFSDHDMWLRIAGKFNMIYIDLPLVKKREHELQLSKTVIAQGLKDEFLLVNTAIHQYPFLKKVERKKLSSLYYALGIVMLQKGNNEKAKLNFLKAFKCRPSELKAIVAYMVPTLYKVIWARHRRSKSGLRKGINWVEV
jgi:glycosyltransferase involved in cell wall biosynthesis